MNKFNNFGLAKSKEEAEKLGINHYFTGKPCKHGHISARILSGDCRECINTRKKTRIYHDKKWGK